MADNRTKYSKNRIYRLKIDELQPDTNQPRKHLDTTEFEGLKESIKRQGLLHPIIFRQNEEGTLIIVSGERRYKAVKELSHKDIPAIYNDGDPFEVAVIENLVREDLTPMAKAEALKKLMDEKDYNNKSIALLLGKSESLISELLSLNNLPATVKDICRTDHRYALRVLKVIAKKKSPEEMLARFEEYRKEIDKAPHVKKENGKKADKSRKKVEVEIKRITALKERFIKGKEDWDDITKKALKEELTSLRALIDEILEEKQ